VTWIAKGSPTWPITLAVGPYTIFEGDPIVADIQSGKPMGLLPPPLSHLFGALFVPDSGVYFRSGLYLNFSVGTPLLFPFALWGVVRLAFARRDRLAVLYVLAVVGLILLGVMSPGAIALRAIWAGVLGRHLLVPVGAAAVLAVVPGVPLGRWAAFLAAATALPLLAPMGWGDRDYNLVTLLLAGLLAATVVAVAARFVPGLAKVRPAAALALICILAYPAVLELRARNRDGYYEDVALRRIFDLHPLGYTDEATSAAWKYLDQDRPLTIAFTGGVTGHGDNWLRYPLLGERLQNRVIYVPVTPDGSIVGIRDPQEALARADFASWVARLAEKGVDYVVVKPPPSVEAGWLESDPTRFTRVDLGPGDSFRVYKFAGDRGAAARY
jgi:hypothetical protein